MSTRTCNSAGTEWGDYVWDDSSCVENECEAGEIDDETQLCPTGFS